MEHNNAPLKSIISGSLNPLHAQLRHSTFLRAYWNYQVCKPKITMFKAKYILAAFICDYSLCPSNLNIAIMYIACNKIDPNDFAWPKNI